MAALSLHAPTLPIEPVVAECFAEPSGPECSCLHANHIGRVAWAQQRASTFYPWGRCRVAQLFSRMSVQTVMFAKSMLWIQVYY